MFCLFFIAIGTANASNVSDDKKINFKDINANNNVNIDNVGPINSELDGTTDVSGKTSHINSNNAINNIVTKISNNDTINTNNDSTTSKNNKNNSLVKNTTSQTIKDNSTKDKSDSKYHAAAGDTKPKKITQAEVMKAADSVYDYTRKNGVLPKYVTMDGYKYSMSEFMYMVTKVVTYKYEGKSWSIPVKYGVKDPKSPSGSSFNEKISSKDYYKYAYNVVKYIVDNKAAPKYASTSFGKMQYQTIIYGYSKLLVECLEKSNGNTLPSSLALKISKNQNLNKHMPGDSGSDSSENTKPSKISQSDVIKAADSVYWYTRDHGVLPDSVTIAGYKYSMSEFMYMVTKVVTYKYEGKSWAVPVKYGVKDPNSPSGSSFNEKISSKDYYKYAYNVVKYIVDNKAAPDYASTSFGKMQYQTIIYGYSKILAWSFEKSSTKSLPSSVLLKISKSQTLNKNMPENPDSKSKIPSSILNDKYNGESLTKYLNPSTNCQSTNSAIKSLSASLTKNCGSDLEKATAIFNWVRDKVSYSFYYDTKKGATGTLNARSGNCVDKSHLLIALMRSAGIASRYVNGEATFSSGSRYGHVWAQVLIGDTWVVADTTSSRNSFGVVNNWNAKTATTYGKYSSISF